MLPSGPAVRFAKSIPSVVAALALALFFCAPASDLTASYEWSGNLVAWQPSGGGVVIEAVTLTDTTAPANDLVEVTATITGAAREIFIRLKTVKP